MEKLTIILLLMSAFQAHGVSFPFMNNNFLLIDCGVIGKYTETYNNQSWLPDSLFMDNGKTKRIRVGADDIPRVMTTLRYFPRHFPNEEDLSCYALPLINTERFVFRAGFYYANYDGKSQPPVFDLLLGGQLWETINSSASDAPIFHELIYTPKDGNISVCLRGREDGGTPFISSLEATYLDHDDSVNQTVYAKMRNGTAYHLVSRLNFGGYDKVVEPWSQWSEPCEEWLNRYWIPRQMPGYENVSFDDANYCSGWYYENRPPNSVFNTAISPSDASQSIYVPITFPSTTPQSAYIVLYLHQNLNSFKIPNATRYMDIYVDGVMRGNVRFEKHISGEVMTLYPLLVQGTANVTISPANGTILPPLLNAMEVFIATQLAEQASDGFKISSCLKISSPFMLVWIFQLVVCVILVSPYF